MFSYSVEEFLCLGKLEEIFEMGVPTLCYGGRHQCSLKDITSSLEGKKKSFGNARSHIIQSEIFLKSIFPTFR